jgi:2-keto-4-pentenoate hydratase/2-oxohepta-3-ene-1,7-dioic acid hydratase in catechol pathway
MPHTLTRQLSRAHATELGKALPTEPVVFSKSPACMVPPGGEIVLPSVEECVDYEGELVVVIGDRSLLSAPSLAPSIEKGRAARSGVRTRAGVGSGSEKVG